MTEHQTDNQPDFDLYAEGVELSLANVLEAEPCAQCSPHFRRSLAS